jgi:hypothetical protein
MYWASFRQGGNVSIDNCMIGKFVAQRQVKLKHNVSNLIFVVTCITLYSGEITNNSTTIELLYY